MSVIIIKKSENTPHTFKLDLELMKQYNIQWLTCFITRCPRCKCLFISRTERKFCTWECQYNKKKKEEKK